MTLRKNTQTQEINGVLLYLIKRVFLGLTHRSSLPRFREEILSISIFISSSSPRHPAFLEIKQISEFIIFIHPADFNSLILLAVQAAIKPKFR